MRIKIILLKSSILVFRKGALLFVLLSTCLVDTYGQMPSHTEKPQDGEVYVVANGIGATKEDATHSALRSAIEQTYGAFVSSNTQILDDEVVKDEIISVSSGNVKHYEYISEREGADGTFYVTLRAIVSYAKLAAFAKSKGGSAELSLSNLAANFKIEQFYAENEKKVLDNLAEQIENICFTTPIYNYEIEVEEPKAISQQGGVSISYKVIPIINSNAAVVYDLFWNTIKGLAVQKPVDKLGLLQYGTTILQGIEEFDRSNYYLGHDVYSKTLYKYIFRLYIKYEERQWLEIINNFCDCHFLVQDNFSKINSFALLAENHDHFLWKLLSDRNLAWNHINALKNHQELEGLKKILDDVSKLNKEHEILGKIRNRGDYICKNVDSFIPRKKKKNTGTDDMEVIIKPALATKTEYVEGHRMIYPNVYHSPDSPITLPFVLHYRVDHDISLPEFRHRYLGEDPENEFHIFKGEAEYTLEELSKVTGLEVKPAKKVYYALTSLNSRGNIDIERILEVISYKLKLLESNRE